MNNICFISILNENYPSNKVFNYCSEGLLKAGIHHEIKYISENHDLDDFKQFDIFCILGTWDERGISLKKDRILNKKVSDYCKQNNKKLLVIESETVSRVIDKSYIKEGSNKFHRIGFHHWLWGKADFIQNSDWCRWINLKKKFNLRLRPWRVRGDKIIICLGFQHDPTNITHPYDFLLNSVVKLRQYTDKPIWVRPHPLTFSTPEIAQFKDFIQNNNLILDRDNFINSLNNTWAVVMDNSTAIFETLYWGIPAFVGGNNFGNPICHSDLSLINTPLIRNREEWFSQLSWTNWSRRELSEELVWNLLLNFPRDSNII